MARGDSRVTYRRRHSYNTRSNKIKKVTTPGKYQNTVYMLYRFNLLFVFSGSLISAYVKYRSIRSLFSFYSFLYSLLSFQVVHSRSNIVRKLVKDPVVVIVVINYPVYRMSVRPLFVPWPNTTVPFLVRTEVVVVLPVLKPVSYVLSS